MSLSSNKEKGYAHQSGTRSIGDGISMRDKAAMEAACRFIGANESRTVKQETSSVSDNDIILIPLEDLVPYHRKIKKLGEEECPVFRDYTEDRLQHLVDDIEKRGVLEPIIVFPSEKYTGKYEILSGEHRTKAQRRLRERHPDDPKWKTIRAVYRSYEVVSADEFAEGDLIYTNTNLHRRSQMKYSEMALVFRVRADALNHKGKRDAQRIPTRDIIAAQANLDARKIDQIQNLTTDKIIKKFLDLIDEGKISLGAAGQQLHMLDIKYQKMIYTYAEHKCDMDGDDIGKFLGKRLTMANLKRIRECIPQNDTRFVLTEEMLDDIFSSTGFRAPSSTQLRKILPDYLQESSQDEILDFLQKAISAYSAMRIE